MKKVICVVLSVLLAVSCLAGLSGCGTGFRVSTAVVITNTKQAESTQR